jgi:hypothetical protein
MEVDGHGKDHAELGGRGDKDGFDGPEKGATKPDGKVGETDTEEIGRKIREHAEVNAELCDARGNGRVGANDIEIAEGAEARENEAFVERDRQAGDGEDDHECHLKAGFEEGTRVQDEDGEG